MTILFTYEYTFHQFGFGGGQVIALNFLEALSKMGHSVSICCAGADDNCYSKYYEFYFSGKYSKLFSSIQAAIHSIKVINKIKPDLVCSFTGEAFAVSLYCNKKKINFCNYIAAPTLPSFNLSNPLHSLINIRFYLTHFFQFLGVRKTLTNFSISNYTLKQLIINWGIPEKNIVNIGCGISNDFITNEDSRSIRVFDICTVGRIEFNQKPINITASALSQSTLWKKWLVVGSGHDEEKFKSLIDKYEISSKTEILGSLNNSQIARILRKTKISILLSTKESFLISAYEAIASQNILIVSDVAQIRHDFTGFPTVFILNSNSEDEIKSLVNHILKNYDELYKYTYVAKKYLIDNYTWDKVATKLLERFI
jgi:glycosyltransferase involved in cell wall biosynthesis